MRCIEVEKTLSLAGIKREEWDDDFNSGIHLKYDNLKVVEESEINNIFNIYLKYYSENRLIGKSNLYIVDTDLSTMDISLKTVLPVIKKWYPHFMKFKTLECGSFTGIGEGSALKTEEQYPDVLPLLAAEMDAISREKGIDIQIIRDIPLHNYPQ